MLLLSKRKIKKGFLWQVDSLVALGIRNRHGLLTQLLLVHKERLRTLCLERANRLRLERAVMPQADVLLLLVVFLWARQGEVLGDNPNVRPWRRG